MKLFSKTFALPLSWTELENVDLHAGRGMQCQGFRLTPYTVLGAESFIGLVDTTAEQTAEERRAILEEKKRRNFKP
jgi:hypothetical protein